MIESSWVEVLVLVLFGFCTGILFTLWYVFHVIKSITLNLAVKIGASFKVQELSVREVVKTITNVIEKSLDEVELAKTQIKQPKK